jgi:acyl-CoA hydrolase
LGKDAKSGTSRETATQIGSALRKHKMGEMDKDKMDIYLMPMDVSNGNQNARTRIEEETDKLETKKRASLQST